MSQLEIIQTFFQYNIDANARLREIILSISPEVFTQPVAYSRGSLRDQVIHQANANRNWLAGFKETPRPEQLDPVNFIHQPALEAWETAEQAVLAFVMGLHEDDLVNQPQGFQGPLWQALLHLANHNTDHRAQMLRILHDFGAPTFEQDMIFYFWGRPPGR